jgi:upstream activation factor subunit UAF30
MMEGIRMAPARKTVAKKAIPAKKATATKTATPATKATATKTAAPAKKASAAKKPAAPNKRVWEYIKKNDLQDKAKRTIL